MRITPLLLAGSLLANGVLIGFVLQRSGGTAPTRATSPAPERRASSDRGGGTAAALQAALESGDADALIAAGCTPEVARQLVIGRAMFRLQARMKELRASQQADARYWRRTPFDPDATAQSRVEVRKAQREFNDELRRAFGADVGTIFGGGSERYGYLSPEKRTKLQRIEQDYADMMESAYADQGAIQLPSDREKMKLLREERERDIAAAMTPEEREQYELHDSPAAHQVMWRYGAALETEEQYRQVYALQKAFADQYANNDGQLTPDQMRERREAERQLQATIDATLTPDQRAALQRAHDSDYGTLAAISRRLNLPATTTDQVIALRASYATQSLDIQRNAALTDQERRTQLTALAKRAEADLQGTLGNEGADAYARRATWMNHLRSGAAFSTNAKDAPSGVETTYQGVYRVGGTREMRRVTAPGR
ncbi:hypothetical protein [Opitutus sp. ER46]|uniref:hypothetical protein n=1 Tax=Opitutus sp. ER46 TaxID=2161864 RepID=UPI000D311838|nr:hypothetical protein [Opitutus sp. ER46]PTX97928.1 hypothetical protein DB354_06540 [Opitutus sp. ER46]